jgi:flavorubredoxin
MYPFKAIRITDKVYWVGAIDWNIRNFHGYATHRGTTYNSYLILADKITLMDAVKAPYKDEMLSRISSIIDPSKIDIVISNHSEMDHSGCLFDIIHQVKPEKVYVSAMGEKALKNHFHIADTLTVVKNGDIVSLGNMNVTFLETKMLHWPDSMFSYIAEEKMLISQDAFGMHLASFERFDHQIDESILKYEAAKYYANIILPYSTFVTNLLKTVKGMNLDIKYILPDHGPIWTSGISKILEWYEEWAQQKPANKAVVVYDTMWKSTEIMAKVIGEGIASGGTTVKIMPLEVTHRSDVATEIMGAGAFVIGSPTLNSTIFPTVADVLYYLKGLRPVNLFGAVFGSFGWAGQSVKELKSFLEDMKIEVLEEIKVNYVPGEEELEKCYEMGKRISDRLSKAGEI